ncbi:chaperone NapD [Desulfolithobacter sp.]
MPIGGVVISTWPEERDHALEALRRMSQVEIYGADEKGNIVAVLESSTTDAMEKLMRSIEKLETVLSVGLTYLNTEDEAQKITRGEYVPQIFGYWRNEKRHDM